MYSMYLDLSMYVSVSVCSSRGQCIYVSMSLYCIYVSSAEKAVGGRDSEWSTGRQVSDFFFGTCLQHGGRNLLTIDDTAR